MKSLKLKPDGWPCLIEECPPGLFVYENTVCFKSEYGNDGIFSEAGEFFVAKKVMVQPVYVESEDEG